MKVVSSETLPSSRKVRFHAGVSHRMVLASDGMGYTHTKTCIDGGTKVFQHYKNHMESCYCVSGSATLTDCNTGNVYDIKPDVTYILDKNDPHWFEAHEDTVLICVFNPPLTGLETHDKDGSYETSK